LVHDIGKIVLGSYFSSDFEMALGVALRENIPLFQAEEIVLGITHADVGAFLAKEWNLPDTAISAIEFHHTPEAADEKTRHVVNVINVADYLVNSMEFGVSGNFSRPTFDKAALAALDISPTKLQEILDEVTEDAQKMESFF
jgi:HD-like signal output (HDOD) protein